MLERNRRRYKVIEKHIELVRQSRFEEAHILYQFLRRNVVTLGLDDSAFEVECFLEDIGCKPSYSTRFNFATFRL